MALAEMLRGVSGRLEQWPRAPELVVLESVMDYNIEDPISHTATAERLASQDLDGLVADLTTALAALTNHAFEQFAVVHRESAAAGEMIRVLRPGQIVVGRYRGVRLRLKRVGYGGRRMQADGTITGGTVVLDSEFDRTNANRRSLRAHELGHALGYNHVNSRVSIMNPQIGRGISDFDREAVRIAYPPRRLDLQ
jgi:hypothetical protein